jgi:sugar (pentulose or hexulose) kinase
MWLSLDIGSSGVKAALLDDDLTVRFRSNSDYPTHSDGTNIEQNVKDWWLSACETMQELFQRFPERPLWFQFRAKVVRNM